MNHPTIAQALAAARAEEFIARADAYRASRLVRRPRRVSIDDPTGIVIRPAAPVDAPELARLAVMDDARVPAAPILVAEASNVIVAAVGSDNAAIADPFVPTEAIVQALRVCTREPHPGSAIRGRLRRLAPWAARRRIEHRPSCMS